MNSIRQEAKRHKGSSQLPNHLSNRIRDKYISLQNDYGVHFDPTVLSLKTNPNLADPKIAPNIQPFFGRKIDIFLSEKGTNDIVFSANSDNWINAARRPYNIVIENEQSGIVESWSRLKSDSAWRKVHYKNGGSSKKSKFNGNLSFIKNLEFRAFNEGVGLLYNNTNMRMYLTFDSAIGKSTSNKDLNSICLECERIPRRRETNAKNPQKVFGYKIKLHGYPVSDSDINSDFSSYSLKLSDIPKVSL